MRSNIRFLAAILLLASATAVAAPPALIPRDVLFGNPERAGPQLSPDGKRLAYLAADAKNVLQVWVQTIGQDDAKMVTADKKRGIRNYAWAEDDQTLLYMQDSDGDENFHVFGVDLLSGNVRDLTPFQGVRAGILATHPQQKNVVLVTANLRKREVFDVYRVDLRSGAFTLDTENPGDVADWTVDTKMVVRGAGVATPDGGFEVRVRQSAKAPWLSILTSGPDELGLDSLSFSEDGNKLNLTHSLGSDTLRVVSRELKGGKETVLAESKAVDAGAVVLHPTRHHVQAVGFLTGRNEWKVIDSTIAPDFAAIAKLSSGDFYVSSRDREDKTWLISFIEDRGPVKFFAYDRKTQQGKLLFVHQPKLEGQPLAEMKPIELPARDGLTLRGYLTLPVGSEPKNLPLVLFVHGGPWTRDVWGFNSNAQWLQNRGYAVLQLNYRGSTGYGKAFLHAGDKQWGKKMHDDLLDAVAWAVKSGVADAKRVAIYGGSYGGYAALAGATFSPDTFKCAVDIVGPSNLFTFIETIPPYWKPMLGLVHARVGHPEKDKELLTSSSPLFSADKIKIPLLIGHGANDPRVKQAESEQIVAALEKNKGSGVYVLYPDEGHGFARPENRIDFNARAEGFLAQQLGGRAEAMQGDKMPGSSAVVKVIGKPTAVSAK